MGELSFKDAAQPVILVGSNASGVESNPVDSDSSGNLYTRISGVLDDSSTTDATEDNPAPVRITSKRALHASIRDASGNERGTESNPIYTAQGISQSAITQVVERRVLTAGSVYYRTENISADTAIKELHVGGRVACECFLAKYVAATTEQIPSGGFNSSGDVSTWTNTSNGSSAGVSWAYATDQSTEGTGSAKHTFTQSDNNNYPEITYTWSTPKDMSAWKTIIGRARVTVAGGGNQSRTVQIRLTSGTAIRIWEVAGTTTTAPFTTEQWHTVTGDLENPHATAGTGTFDINNVNSISLRLQDGGNKSGSVWWDDIELVGQITIQDKIYSASGSTMQLVFDPIKVFDNGDVLMLALKNNGATTAEIQGATSGVAIV